MKQSINPKYIKFIKLKDIQKPDNNDPFDFTEHIDKPRVEIHFEGANENSQPYSIKEFDSIEQAKDYYNVLIGKLYFIEL